MSHYPSHILQKEYADEWQQYLTRFPWEWFCTFTLSDQRNGYLYGIKRFHRWRLQLIKREQLQLGGYILSSHKRGHTHFHALLVGLNRKGKTLFHCSCKKWESEWIDHARIKAIEDVEHVSAYVAAHFLGFKSDRVEIDSFGNNLLRRLMGPQYDGLDNYDGLCPPPYVLTS